MPPNLPIPLLAERSTVEHVLEAGRPQFRQPCKNIVVFKLIDNPSFTSFSSSKPLPAVFFIYSKECLYGRLLKWHYLSNIALQSLNEFMLGK
jgi:hypothetical protein